MEKEIFDILQEKEPAILAKIGLASKDNVHVPKLVTKSRSFVEDQEAIFRKVCVDTVDNIRNKNTLTFMCAVDGSDAADVAFITMMHMKRRLDHVCLFHVFSKEENRNLPKQYQESHIYEHYEAELIRTFRIAVSRFAFYWEERRSDDVTTVLSNMLDDFKGKEKFNGTTNSQLSSPTNGKASPKQEPNFFFCGNVGRSRAGGEDEHVPGTFTDFAVRHCHMPVVVVKNICPLSARFFIIAVDGSPLSKRGFDVVITLINPRDKLRVINVYNPLKTGSGCEPPPEEIEEFYSNELKTIGPSDSKFKTLVKEGGVSLAEMLVEYANHNRADFFALSPRTRPELSAITEYVICNVNANVILCKN